MWWDHKWEDVQGEDAIPKRRCTQCGVEQTKSLAHMGLNRMWLPKIQRRCPKAEKGKS